MGTMVSWMGGKEMKEMSNITRGIYVTDARWQHACSGRNITWNYINNKGVLPWPYTECPDAAMVLRAIQCNDTALPHCKDQGWLPEVDPQLKLYERNHWEGLGDPLKMPNPPPWFPHKGIFGNEQFPRPNVQFHPTKPQRLQYWTSANGVTWNCDQRCDIRYMDPRLRDHEVGKTIGKNSNYKTKDYDCSIGCRNPSSYDACLASCSGQHEAGTKRNERLDQQSGHHKRNLPSIPQTVWNTTAFPNQVWHSDTDNSASPLSNSNSKHARTSDMGTAHHAPTGILITALALISLAALGTGLYRYKNRERRTYRMAKPQYSDLLEEDAVALELTEFCDAKN